MNTLITIIILTLLQALFFGRIHLFGVAIPLVYTWFVLRTKRGTSRILLMVLSFILGLAVDIFGNTPGLAATSMTLIACIQPYVLELFLRREDAPNFKPTLHTLGFLRYLTYALILLSIYCLVFFTLYLLPGFTDWFTWFLSVLSSLLLTLAVVIAIETSKKSWTI